MKVHFENLLNFCFTAAGYLNGTCIVFIIFISLLFVSSRRRRDIPPGPPLLPVVGNLVSLCTKDIETKMINLRKKYGDIFSLYVGQEVVIVLNGYEVIHNALVCNGRAFSRRPTHALKDLLKETGIIFTNGEAWKQQRNFAQRTINDICYQNNASQIKQILKEEVISVVEEVSKSKEAIDIKHTVDVYSLNVIFRVVCGHRFSFNDPNAMEFINAFHDIAVDLSVLQVIVNCVPFVQKLPGDVLKVDRLFSKREKLFSFARHFCEQTSGKGKTFAAAFQDEITQKRDKLKGIHMHFTDDRKQAACLDLIGAASDTTANAILWILLYLTREQEIQDRIYTEISYNVGLNNDIDIEDRHSLPYTHAVILEGLRVASSTPFALPHSVADDIYINNFLIPAGCTVLPNLTSVLKDPEIFKKPEKFLPERFLNSTGTEVVVPKEFIAFSVGPRSCLGESLAKKEIFMIVSTLMQKFKLLPETPGDIPTTVGRLSTVLKPLPFKVKIIKR